MGFTTLGSNRREFLKTSVASSAAALFGARLVRAAATNAATSPAAAPPVEPTSAPCKVALTNGDSRPDNVVRAMKSLEKEIAQAIGNRRVVIKPNNVVANNQLASTHADTLDAVLDVLKSMGKLDGAIIAESGTGNTMQGFGNYGYTAVAEKYHVELVDLDQTPCQTIMAFDQSDAMPHAVRVSSILANQRDNFIISATPLKTHNYAIATMSIKNIVLGAPLKFPIQRTAGGFGGGMRMGGGGGGRGGARGGRMNERAMMPGSDKPILHGGGSRGININIAMLAPLLHPSLSVIDGFEGMQGNGPISGTPVDHRVCVVSTDYLAADCVGAHLMGLDPMDVGYLSYLADAKVGVSDVSEMEILGESIESLAKKYQLGSSIETQLQWKNPAEVISS